MTAAPSVMRGVYWRCPECSATVTLTMPNTMGWFFSALGLGPDVDTELDLRLLPTTHFADAERLVEEHEDGHLLWREFDAKDRPTQPSG